MHQLIQISLMSMAMFIMLGELAYISDIPSLERVKEMLSIWFMFVALGIWCVVV